MSGKKFDQGKAPVNQGLFQYFPRALEAVARVSKFGLEKYNLKYSDVNWKLVEDGENRYKDSIARHQLREYIDGPEDPESKMLHASHAAWNALARLELMLTSLDREV